MDIVFRPEQWDELCIHLFKGRPEWVAFLFGKHDEDSDQLRIEDVYRVPLDRYAVQGPFHVELDDEVRPEVIKAAFDKEAILIEVHSHRSQDIAAFSPTDFDGLEEFVPHVLWRLSGRPYVALVLAEGSFDGLSWAQKNAQAETIRGIRIDGGPLRSPTAASLGPLLRRSTNG